MFVLDVLNLVPQNVASIANHTTSLCVFACLATQLEFVACVCCLSAELCTYLTMAHFFCFARLNSAVQLCPMSGFLSATAWIGVDANIDHVSYKCHVLPLTTFSFYHHSMGNGQIPCCAYSCPFFASLPSKSKVCSLFVLTWACCPHFHNAFCSQCR